MNEKGQHETSTLAEQPPQGCLGIMNTKEIIRDKHWRQLKHVKDFLDKLQQQGMPPGLVLKGSWEDISVFSKLDEQATALRFGNGHVGSDIYRDLKAAGPYVPLKFKQLVCFLSILPVTRMRTAFSPIARA